MSYYGTSINELLDKDHWDYDEIKLFLEQDASSVSEVFGSSLAPLHRVLESEKCSVGIVELLLHYGADANLVSKCNLSPLHISLSFDRDKDVIRALVDNGADVNKVSGLDNLPPLFTALGRGASLDVIRILVDAGSDVKACTEEYFSSLHFALKSPNSEVKADVCKLLLDRGAHLEELDRNGQSLLCFALRQGSIKLEIFQLLLDAGCSLNSCKCHDSPWLCATAYSRNVTLDVVKLLLSKGGTMNCENDLKESPLHCALKYGAYESRAIRLMLSSQEVDIGKVTSLWGESLLHAAVSNPECKSSIVKLLINRGVPVNAVDRQGDTPLHTVVKNSEIDPNNVRVLLNNGVDVKKLNGFAETPLSIAVENGNKPNVLKLLLRAGARIGAAKHKALSMLQLVLSKYDSDRSPENLDCLQMFLKFAVLENLIDEIQVLIQERWDYEELSLFVDECQRELVVMESKFISHGFSLRQFVTSEGNWTMIN